MLSVLSKSPLFIGLSPQIITTLLDAVNYQVKTYAKGQLIASRDEECENLLVLLEGSVKGEMLDYSGKVLKVEDIYAPRPIASAFIFGQNNKFPVDVIATTDIKVLSITSEELIKLFQKNEVFLKNYLNTISNRAQFLSRRIWFLSFKTIKGKLAQYILSLAKNNAKVVELDKTQQQLADFFGVTRPSLARALGEMETEGIIDVKRKTITLIDKQKLLRFLQ